MTAADHLNRAIDLLAEAAAERSRAEWATALGVQAIANVLISRELRISDDLPALLAAAAADDERQPVTPTPLERFRPGDRPMRKAPADPSQTRRGPLTNPLMED